MNIQQLEYIIAVDNCRHFAKAAEFCFVTQPTLSMMIQKLEDELDVKIFDRSRHPVEPTPIGLQIIEQARISLKHFKQIKEIVENEQNTAKGTFRLGIIPTIAHYIVPLLLEKLNTQDAQIEVIMKENTTKNIISDIQKGFLDGGLLAGPLNHPEIREYSIYYEKFFAYVSPSDRRYEEKEIDLETLSADEVWLLESEHCLRGQIERLCHLKQAADAENTSVKYESGSIDTLVNIVDYNRGLTVIPEMHAMGLSEEKQDNLREFKGITAVREVSLVTSNDYIRKTMINSITDVIRSCVPKSMLNQELKKFVVDI
ncbi:MAG: hydrogen peroxide-inducible genes activator [Dysgonamonadaceae bacterium]|jgi:LysR family hydrogen peroxide-inducible transcriptional activator|nr:hydrogen peroxide-inducible genes activator [Dysgonamonadaceae bacterium]